MPVRSFRDQRAKSSSWKYPRLEVLNAEATPEPDGDISLEWYADPEFNLSISFGNKKELPYSCFLGEKRHYGVMDPDQENPEINSWLDEITERFL